MGMSSSQMQERPAPLPAASPAPPAGARAQPAIDSAELLRGGKAIAISHNGEVYRLQTTRQGKLILTK